LLLTFGIQNERYTHIEYVEKDSFSLFEEAIFSIKLILLQYHTYNL